MFSLKKACKLAINLMIGMGVVIIIVGIITAIFVFAIDTGFFSLWPAIGAFGLITVAYLLGKLLTDRN